MGKLSTPDWIREGFDSKADWEKAQGKKKVSNADGPEGKTFKVRKCPKCGDDVQVVVEKESNGEWECKSCGWQGTQPKIEELPEDEFMKYLDEKEEKNA